MPATEQEAPTPTPVVEVPTPTTKPKAPMPTPVVEVPTPTKILLRAQQDFWEDVQKSSEIFRRNLGYSMGPRPQVEEAPTPTTDQKAPTPTPVVEAPMPATEHEATMPTPVIQASMPTTNPEAPVPNVTIQYQAPMLPDTPHCSVRPKDSVTFVTPQQGDKPLRHPAGLTAPQRVLPRPTVEKSCQAPVQGANSNVSKAAAPSTASKPASSSPQTQRKESHHFLNPEAISRDPVQRIKQPPPIPQPDQRKSRRRLHHLSSAQLRARERRGPHKSKRGRPPRHPNPGRRMINHDPERLHRPEDSLRLRCHHRSRLLCRDHLRPNAQG